ncbi:MAG: hypothetical protein C0506_00465 [Anaerolinea sp.]|nr:hypothetical protein [Anaerolinea sp.]
MVTMRRLTISLDEETATWLRARATERDTSVSSLVGEMLRREMEREYRYLRAMNEFLATPPFLKRDPGESWPSRDETHRRSGIA